MWQNSGRERILNKESSLHSMAGLCLLKHHSKEGVNSTRDSNIFATDFNNSFEKAQSRLHLGKEELLYHTIYILNPPNIYTHSRKKKESTHRNPPHPLGATHNVPLSPLPLPGAGEVALPTVATTVPTLSIRYSLQNLPFIHDRHLRDACSKHILRPIKTSQDGGNSTPPRSLIRNRFFKDMPLRIAERHTPIIILNPRSPSCINVLTASSILASLLSRP